MEGPKLRFKAEDGSDFPEWENNILGNYSYLRGRIGFRGYTKNDIVSKEQGGVAALSPTNIVDSCICFRNATYVTREKYEESPEIKLQEKDILFVKTGSTLGKFGYINILEEEATVNPQMVVITALECNPYFLFLALNEKNAKEFVSKIKVGGAVPTLSQEELKKLPIRIPCRNEQQKIADFLSTIDSIISSQKEELAVWEQRKKGIMQKLFSQEVRFKADDGSDFPEWEEKRLKDICCKIGSGKTPKGGQEIYQDCGVMLIRSQNVRNGFLDLTDVAYISNEINQTMLGSTLKFNDLLLNITGASIGRCCKYNTTQQGNVNQHVCVLRIENQEDTLPDFALSYLLSDLIQNQIDLEQSGGSREGLNFQQVGNLKIKLPSLPEQKKIADCLSSIDEVIKKEKEELEKWQELKKGLLQQMFV